MTKNPENPHDQWDPESLALGQDFSATGETEELLTNVGLGKFSDVAFIRAHETFRQDRLPFLRLKDDLPGGQKKGEWYFVRGPALKILADRITLCTVYPLISLTRQIRLWPIPMDLGNGTWHAAYSSGTEAVKHARYSWIQIIWNGSCFRTERAKADYGEPKWFEGVPFAEMLRLALQYRTIEKEDNSVLQQVKGLG